MRLILINYANQIYSHLSSELQSIHAKYGKKIKTTKLAMKLKLL